MTASAEELEDALLACRYGDVEDLNAFIASHGAPALSDAKDENGNTVLHMACANGHEDILAVLLPIVDPSLLSAQNSAGSTPLHWAALNKQMNVAKALVGCSRGPGARLIDIKNNIGRTPLGEAELAGWDEGSKWMVEIMDLETGGDAAVPQDTDEAVPEADVEVDRDTTKDVELEIRDADGGVAKMSLVLSSTKNP